VSREGQVGRRVKNGEHISIRCCYPTLMYLCVMLRPTQQFTAVLTTGKLLLSRSGRMDCRERSFFGLTVVLG
jgi:hypothetical protein